MKNIKKFEEFNEPLNEGVDSLAHYYSNSDKSIKDYAKKIDAIINKEIQSGATKKQLVDLIIDLVHDYAVEYSDNKRPW